MMVARSLVVVVQTMLALARLHIATGDLDAAMYQLTALLRVDKSNNDATMVCAHAVALAG